MTSTPRSIAPLAGLAYGVVAIAGTLVHPRTIEFADDPAAIVAALGADESRILAGDTLYLLGAALLLVFAVALRAAGRRAEGGVATASAVAFAGCAAGATLALGAASMEIMAVLRLQDRGAIDPQVATALLDASSIMFGLAAAVAFGVGVLGAAVLAFRHRMLPAWYGAVSAVLGVALLVPPISYIAVTAAFTLWVLATGLMLYARPASRPAAAPSPLAVGAS